jgi:hypothetical protein
MNTNDDVDVNVGVASVDDEDDTHASKDSSGGEDLLVLPLDPFRK